MIGFVVLRKGEKMNDLISRQAAIEIIQSMYPGMPRVPWMRKDWAKKYESYIRIEKEIKELSSVQQWTPIDKNCPDRGELPDNCVSVLISVEDETCESYRDGDYWFLDETFVPLDFADAWMFMPKPYKGET